MYKILLVDDEELVIKSLMATVNWEVYGFRIIGYALTAEEAVEKVERLKPEVVITDIKMPNINGLELIQMIKSVNPQIDCIVISGHAEFAYIQKSILLEAVGYCLKPFDEDEIGIYLKRIKEKLDKLEENIHLTCLLDYMQSTSEEALEYMEKVYKEREISFEDSKICAVYIMGAETIYKPDFLILRNAGHQKYICLITENTISSVLNRILKNYSNAHIGISRVIPNSKKVAKAIRDAKCCAYQFFCQEDSRQITSAAEFRKDMTLIQALDKSLMNNDIRKISKYILEISDKFISGEYNIEHAIRLQNMYTSWILHYDKDREIELIFEYETLCDTYNNVFDLLYQIETDFNKLNSTVTYQNNKMFGAIFQFIEKNYLNQINITQLSEEFHINACYFSQLFKKEVGCTFTDYLAKKRIDYAGKLLLETDLKVNEIAEMSGFHDYFYFSRVFRKIKNCSPTEYRSK